MDIKQFAQKYRVIIIILGLLLLLFILYRYFIKKNGIFRNIRFDDRNKNANVTSIDKSKCLDPKIQQQIADDINKKLQEINACDCGEACKSMFDKMNTQSNPSINLIESKTVPINPETFGNDDFY